MSDSGGPRRDAIEALASVLERLKQINGVSNACDNWSPKPFDSRVDVIDICSRCHKGELGHLLKQVLVVLASGAPQDETTLRARILLWRREYGAFGHLSGETLAEMDREGASGAPPHQDEKLRTFARLVYDICSKPPQDLTAQVGVAYRDDHQRLNHLAELAAAYLPHQDAQEESK